MMHEETRRDLSGEHVRGERRQVEEIERKNKHFSMFHVYAEKVGGNVGDKNKEGPGRAEQRRESKYE